MEAQLFQEEAQKNAEGTHSWAVEPIESSLASIYLKQGRWKEVEQLQAKIMETEKSVLSQEHPNTLASNVMGNLASTYQDQRRWKEAEKQVMLVMETRQRVIGQKYPNTLAYMDNLASTYRNQGRWKEAEELFVQVMETRKRVDAEGGRTGKIGTRSRDIRDKIAREVRVKVRIRVGNGSR